MFHVVQGHDDELHGRGMATPVAVGGRHRQSRCCEFVTSRGSELDKGGVTDARAIAWLACSAGPNVGRDVSVIWPNERSAGATERATQRAPSQTARSCCCPMLEELAALSFALASLFVTIHMIFAQPFKIVQFSLP